MRKNQRISSRVAGTFGTLLWAALLVQGTLRLGAQSPLVLKVRHDHAFGGCSGTFTLDDRGVRYETSHKEHVRSWSYEEVQQFQIEQTRKLKVLTYEDRKWRLGADKVFEFSWTDEEAAPEEVYDFLRARTRRPIATWLRPSDPGTVRYEFPAKHLGAIQGRQGRLLFAGNFVVFQSEEKGGDRAWRYDDLESISSSGPYDLMLTTSEQQKFHYASRRVYNFQLKEALPQESYDALWRFVNEKKGVKRFGAEPSAKRGG